MLALAIDLGGTHAACAVLRNAEVLCRETVESCASDSLAPMLPRLAAVLRQMASRTGISIRDCAGLALGFCGLADFSSGQVLSTNKKYDDAPQIDLSSWSRAEFGLPFRIENDARMALLGERHAGAARGYDDIVMITLGTGIGGATMIGGKLLRGRHNQAGCLGGHLIVNPRGRRCTCGAIGCAESEASTWALPLICAGWPGFRSSRVAQEQALDFAALFRIAGTGDAVANEVVDYCIDVWAALAVSLIHAYDPEVIVIGGGIMGSGGRILSTIRRRVEETAWTPWGKVRVEPAQCGDNAALLGAIPLLSEAGQ